MGYTIIIGERPAKRGERPDLIHHEKGPAFGEPTDGENQRWPSYSGWEDFCLDVDRYCPGFAARFGEFKRMDGSRPNTLLRQHPGCYRLWRSDLRLVETALMKFVEGKFNSHWSHIGGTIPLPRYEGETNVTGGDQNLGRLVWLHYWVKWAVNNCQSPVMYNS